MANDDILELLEFSLAQPVSTAVEGELPKTAVAGELPKEEKSFEKQNTDKNIDALISLTDYLNKLGIPSSSERYTTIMDMWIEGGEPYTKVYPIGGDFNRAEFTTGEKNPKTPDTLHVNQGIEDLLAELAHAIQFNVSSEVRDSLRKANFFQKHIFGEKAQGTNIGFAEGLYYPEGNIDTGFSYRLYKPGESERDYPVEFEAHQVIEPLLKKRYDDALKKDKGY